MYNGFSFGELGKGWTCYHWRGRGLALWRDTKLRDSRFGALWYCCRHPVLDKATFRKVQFFEIQAAQNWDHFVFIYLGVKRSPVRKDAAKSEVWPWELNWLL